MGTMIFTDIRPKHITKQQWKEVYDESLILLKAFKFARINSDEFNGQKRYYLDNKCLEDDNELKTWQVCGDSKYMKTAETFTLTNDINKYASSIYSDEDDILLLSLNEEYKGICSIFDSKTQGEPYHKYILAIACLLESRFPRDITVYGDITREQALDAVEWANKHLDKSIHIPARTDYNMLYERLKPLVAKEDLLNSICKLKNDKNEVDLSKLIKEKFSKKDLDDFFINRLNSFDSISQVGAQQIITSALKIGYILEDIINLLFVYNKQRFYSEEEFIRCIAKSDIFLKEEEKKILEFIEPRREKSPVTNQILFNIMIDMKLPSRNTHYYIDINEAISLLEKRFTAVNDIKDLVYSGYETTKELVSGIDSMFKDINNKYEIGDADISASDELLYYEDGDIIASPILCNIDNYIDHIKEKQIVEVAREKFLNVCDKKTILTFLYTYIGKNILRLRKDMIISIIL